MITAKGRRLLERARRLIHEVDDELLGGLSAAERRQLTGLLRRALESAPAQPLWSSAEGDQRMSHFGAGPMRPACQTPPIGVWSGVSRPRGRNAQPSP